MSQGPNYKALVTDALLQLELMQQKLDAQQRAQHEPIAIVGMGCRYPGGVNSPEDFWQLLVERRDGIGDAGDRWNLSRVYDPDPMVPGKMYSRHIGMMDRIAEFDADFFGIAPREAEAMDPQQRILLEVSWHALEQAGYTMPQLKNIKGGVYIGIGMQDYSALRGLGGTPETLSPYDGTGNALSVSAGRISYVYGLRGPSMAIETACSSSLVAMHLAIQGLRSGETDLAIAGGVNLVMNPATSVVFSKAMLLSPDGRCRTFDKSANGYVRSDGCGLVVLKRLSDAVANGDRVLAIVRGSAVNQDGRSQGITAPNEKAQEEVIGAALKNAQVSPADIDYIEAHGTGTALGDPIEVNALGTVFSGNHDAQHPLLLGSVKTNIGHCETASGIAGVIKTVLALQHKTLPAQLHFDTPNPYIPWNQLPFEVVSKPRPWDREKRFAGVSSFGFSGTNAHIVLQSAPEQRHLEAAPQNSQRLPLTLSARDDAALRTLAANYAAALNNKTGNKTGNDLKLADVCAASNRNRGQMNHKLTIIDSERENFIAALTDFAAGKQHPLAHTAITGERAPKIAFVFAGQGPQFIGMGHELYQQFPIFRDVIDRCEKALTPYWNIPLTSVLWGEHSDRLAQTRYTQAALFAVQFACAELWRNFGARPSRVLGHSFGEYAAACLAGVFSLEDALMLLVARGGLPQEKSAPGLMLSALTDRGTMDSLLEPHKAKVSYAAINGPQSLVISGDRDAVLAIDETARLRGIKTRQLDVSHAFHSPQMDCILDEFRAVAQKVTYHKPKIPLVSCTEGKLAGQEIACAEYWTQHLRNTVDFAAGIAALAKGAPDILMEMGPGTTLLGMARPLLDPAPLTYLPSFREGSQERNDLLEGLLNLHHAGAPVQWHNLYGKQPLPACNLPRYAFQRKFHWFTVAPDKLAAFTYAAGKYASQKTQEDTVHLATADDTDYTTSSATDDYEIHSAAFSAAPSSRHPLFSGIVKHPLLKEKIYETILDPIALPWLKQHKVYDEIIVAGGFFLSAIYAALQDFSSATQWELHNIQFLQPLRITTGEAPVLTILFSEEEGAVQIELLTQADQQHKRLHARAELRPATESIDSVAIDDWQQFCQQAREPFERDAFYIALKDSTHLFHGADFQWNDKLWCTQDGVISRLLSPPGITLHPQVPLHAGLIDSAFQAIAALALFAGGDLPTAVPRSIARMRLHNATSTQRLWCRSRISATNSNGADIEILLVDETGTPVLSVDGFRVQQIDSRLFRQLLDNIPVTDCWDMTWREQAQPPAQKPGPDRLGNVLVLSHAADAGNPLLQNLLRDLPGYSRALLTLQHCTDSQADHNESSIHYLDLSNSTAIESAFNRLENSGWRPDTILHTIGLHATGLHAAEISADIDTDNYIIQQDGCGTMLALLHALRQWQGCTPRLITLTLNSQTLNTQICGAPFNPGASALWGMLRTARLEYPDFHCKLLDCEPGIDAETLLQEILLRDDENEVLLRRHQRLVPRIVPVEISDTSAAPAFDSNALYLITGGLGALGMTVANWLIANGARHLALCARSSADATQLQRIEHWREQGATIQLFETDISDRHQVKTLLGELQQQATPLTGIFHIAGVIRDKLINNLQWQDFEAVMAPKVAGTWNLHQETQTIPLTHFVCFSSIAAFIGNAGQANYSAANAFVDQLMQWRRANGLPGQSINWGPWAEIGMAAHMPQNGKSQLALMGVSALDTELALQRLGMLLQQNAPQRAVLAVDWSRFIEQWPLATDKGFLAEIAHLYAGTDSQTRLNLTLINQLRSLTAEQRRDAVLTYIHSEICRVLNKTEVDLEMSVLGMGIDSLMAMEFRARMKRELAMEIPVPKLLEGPSIRTLALYVADQFNDDYFKRVDQQASATPVNEIDEIATAHLLEQITQDANQPEPPQVASHSPQEVELEF